MLYVFHVDTGKMRTFDMNLALESVRQLKEAIEYDCGIPANKQVLLVSGGQALEPNARVCSYSAGTDTNPIFLFSKCTIESKTPPNFTIDFGSDVELKEQLEGTRDLPDTYMTVNKRVKLAQQYCDLARDQTRICEHLVHDQHLQQQGWAAVLANLEDTAREFRSRVEIFKLNYLQYLETHQLYTELLKNFHEDLAILSKIPVCPALLESSESASVKYDGSTASCGSKGPDQEACKVECEEDSGIVSRADVMSSATSNSATTLLQWITAKDNQSSLHQFAERCIVGVEAFNEEMLEARMKELEQVLQEANRTEMKEVKGLEDRLYGLDQLMCEAKKYLQEQGDLAQSFSHNQTRVNNLGDPSILPDLCKSHRHYLQMMQNNHQRVLGIRDRCARAKEELCLNLHLRLKWVMYVENSLFEADGKLVMYHDNLRRLRHNLEVAQQVHLAPQMYISAVSEVVRRQTFSRAFLTWASDLSCQLLAVHNEEVARRAEFKTRFDGHFLNSLFPGMEDLPPPFATQAPSTFDTSLPKLTMEDFQNLKQELPQLSFSLTHSELESITQFFLVRSFTGTLKLDEKEQVKELENHLVKVVTDAGLASAETEDGLLQPSEAEKHPSGQSPSPVFIQGVVHLKDQDRGFESETDTEEFEKVGQSPVELRFDAKQVAAVTGGADEGPGATIATLEVGVPAGQKLPPSPRSPPLPPARSQEFVAADFYIDESMPSSYSESSGNQAVPELQRRLEDTYTLVTLLQENLGCTRSEVDRLRGLLLATDKATSQALTCVRDELSLMRTRVVLEREELAQLCRDLAAELSRQQDRHCRQARELVQRLTVDHELEMDAFRREFKTSIDSKEELLKSLNVALDAKEKELSLLGLSMEQRLEEEVKERTMVVSCLEHELTACRMLCQDLQSRLDAAELDKAQALKEQADNLHFNYKAELENLRSRFRMATASMERSPSDSSLEKIERPDIIAEKEAAIKLAVEQERARWEARLEHEIKAIKMKADAEKQVWFNEAIGRVMEKKDRQLDALRARESSLEEEIKRLHSSQSCRSLDSVPNVSSLQSDRVRPEGETSEEVAESGPSSLPCTLESMDRTVDSPVEMSTSVAVVPEGSTSRDVATSPEPTQRSILSEQALKEKLTRSQTSLIQQGKISIASCNPGDAVLVMWDEEHSNYTIVQDTSTLYFLHSDYVEGLGLKPAPDGSSRRYSSGEVVDKEFCHAKKSENRYRVPKGTKFYRVRVKPLPREASMVRSHHHHNHHHNLHHESPLSASTSSPRLSSFPQPAESAK